MQRGGGARGEEVDDRLADVILACNLRFELEEQTDFSRYSSVFIGFKMNR